MTGDRKGGGPPSTTDLARDNLRLARRIGRLEEQLAGLEEMRDTNARVLERLREDLERERGRSHDLLLNVLPQPIIDRLNAGEDPIADRHEGVVVVLSDFVRFTEISAQLPVATLVGQLNALFSSFDRACADLGVEKIKTIGDAYMAAAGLPGSTGNRFHAVADLALAMREAVEGAGSPWQIRIGIHAGSVVAGVLGTRKFVYDLWGDTVNVASRLETTAPVGSIQVSGVVADGLVDAFELEPRGSVDLKGKGAVPTWLLVGRA